MTVLTSYSRHRIRIGLDDDLMTVSPSRSIEDAPCPGTGQGVIGMHRNTAKQMLGTLQGLKYLNM